MLFTWYLIPMNPREETDSLLNGIVSFPVFCYNISDRFIWKVFTE